MKKLTLLAFSLSLFTSVAATAEPVDYLDWDGAKLVSATCTDYEVVTNGASAFAAGKTYVVADEVSTASRITVEGTSASPTRLILCDGATLTAVQGIEVGADRALVICGQSGGTGTLAAKGGRFVAGIGGNGNGAGGAVTVNGGIVMATGGSHGAGIGGGDGSVGGTVTINGGGVTATGGMFSAGIGGGAYGGDGGAVTVNGGTVTATGGAQGAGIGGGVNGAGGTVTVNGGTVTAMGDDNGAGIGGGFSIQGGGSAAGGTLRFADGVPFAVWAGDVMPGRYSSPKALAEEHRDRYIHIESGKVTLVLEGACGYQTVVSDKAGAVVENKSYDPDFRAYVVTTGETVTVDFVLEEGGEWEVAPKANPMTFENLMSNTVVPATELPTVRRNPVPYLDWDPVTQKMTNALCSAYEFYEGQTILAAGTWYVVRNEVTVLSRIFVNGTTESPTRLILCDGTKLTAMQGLEVAVGSDGATTNALVICGQSGGSGALVATGGEWCAGIGGGDEGDGGAVTVNGGTVTATGGRSAAGIGGGSWGAGGTITINGGTVTATGDDSAAGIGGDDGAAGGALRFAEGVPFAVWAGDVMPGRHSSSEALAEDHGARYVHIESGKVMLILEGACGYRTVVSNDADGVVESRSADFGVRVYAVTAGETTAVAFELAEGDEWEVAPSENPMTFRNLTADTVVPAAKLPRVRHNPVPYLDWDPVGRKMTNAICSAYESYEGQTDLAAGVWYVVRMSQDVHARISVEGTTEDPTRLILCDGATLRAAQGIEVAVGENGATTNALVICGQQGGTGALVATGGDYAAGIGDGDWGIGGGVITINGGTVTATGGYEGAGIGGGYGAAGGVVTITGGAVKVVAGSFASVIGHGWDGDDDGVIAISGGVFGMAVSDRWLAEGYDVIDNLNPGTRDDYPYEVVQGMAVKVTVGALPKNVTAFWTSGDGSCTNAVKGASFKVRKGLENVKVLFAPAEFYAVDKTEYAFEGPILADCAVPAEALPTVRWAYAWQVGEGVVAHIDANRVLAIEGTGAMSNFVNAADVPWDPALVTAVTIGEGVTKIGANAFVTLADAVTVNGLPIAFQKDVAAAAGASEPVIPEGMVLVSKTELAAADAETLTIVGGMAYVGVSVRTNADLTAETKSWGKVNVRPGDVSVENGAVIIAVPANAEKGFMVLESGD